MTLAPATVPPGHPVAARLADVTRRIAEAAAAVGREPSDVTLIAVSKTFGPETIAPAIIAGQRIFGENRVQEAKAKWPALRSLCPGIELHLIGPVQTNKAADAVALFACIHSLDRAKLARALAAEMDRQGRAPRLFVQVNTGAEAHKAGVAPAEADRFIAECRDHHGLVIAGLMCIPPLTDDPARHFALLAEIARRNGIDRLSMGMSGDFEAAIRQGATHVRIGSAIFGDRDRG